MPAYMIIEARISDPQKFAPYARANPPIIAQYGGRYVAMRGHVEALEGELGDSRIVLSQWPDLDSARRYWNSPEYQAIKPLREGAGEFRVLLVEGTAPQ